MEKTVLISQLKIGIRFTIKGFDGVYVKSKHNKKYGIEYYKEGLEELIYCADKPILKVIR